MRFAGLACAAIVLGGYGGADAETLRAVSSFSDVDDAKARSVALFTEAGKVLLHPRCLNCHPSTARPRQGDARVLHEPPVRRGPGGHGVTAMRCSTCHTSANFDPAGVPGAAHWALAPASMAWEGRSLGQICAQLKDPARNGGRKLPAVVEHMSKDALVGWAWTPGAGREAAPGTQAEFGALIAAWVKDGAACPAP